MQTAEQHQPEPTTPPVPGKPKTFAIGDIFSSARNPRQTFDQAALEELAQSFRSHGFQGALTVRETADGRAELVCGERRLRAAKMAGLTELLCIVCDLSDEAAYDLALAENKARRDLHPLEEAEAFQVKAKEFGRSAAEIAATIGEKVQYVSTRLQLLHLCDEGKEAFRAGRLTFNTALLVSRIPDQDLQRQAIKEITSPNGQGDAMAPGAAAAHVRHRFMLSLDKAPFPITDDKLVATAGSCSTCPHRTGNQRELFSDVPSPDVCTKPPCYEAKVKAHGDRIIEEAKHRGAEVLGAKKAKEMFPWSWSGMDSRELVDLSATCHDDPKHRTYGQLLGSRKEPAKPEVVVRNPHTGSVHQLVHAKGLKQKLKRAGHDFAAKREAAPRLSPKEQQAQEAAARKRRTLPIIEQQAIEEVAEAAMRRKPDVALWLLLIEIFAEHGEGQAFKRRNIDLNDPFALIRDWNENQLRGIAIELLLDGERIPPWSQELSPRLQSFAKHFGVDLARIEKAALAADAKASAGGKGKKGETTPRTPAKKPAKDFKRAAAGDDEGDEDEGDAGPIPCRVPTPDEQRAFSQEHPEHVAPMPAVPVVDPAEDGNACLNCRARPGEQHAEGCEDHPAVVPIAAPVALADDLVDRIARAWGGESGPVDPEERALVREGLSGDPELLKSGKWTTAGLRDLFRAAKVCGAKTPDMLLPACLRPHGRLCTEAMAVIASELGACEVCKPAVDVLRAEAERGRCRVCRCTEHDACPVAGSHGLGCSWADVKQTLCSVCIGHESETREQTWSRIVKVQGLSVQRIVERWGVTLAEVDAALYPNAKDGADARSVPCPTCKAKVDEGCTNYKGGAIAPHSQRVKAAAAAAAKRLPEDAVADPALRVACGMCHAKPGEKCHTPGLKVPRGIHRERRRDEAALPDTKTLTVECPDCKAAPGKMCRRPGGRRADAIHNARQDAVGKD